MNKLKKILSFLSPLAAFRDRRQLVEKNNNELVNNTYKLVQEMHTLKKKERFADDSKTIDHIGDDNEKGELLEKIEVLEKENKKYRELLDKVLDCQHPNVFHVAGQLLAVQSIIKNDLKK